MRSYKASPMAGRGAMLFARRGAAQQQQQAEEEVEEEEKPKAKPKKLTFKDGLPVRDAKQKVVTEFDITFGDHGSAKLPDLDPRAQKLLGIGQ